MDDPVRRPRGRTPAWRGWWRWRGGARRCGRCCALAAAPMLPMVAYMQVRTRLIDDVVRSFVGFGGGAARAARRRLRRARAAPARRPRRRARLRDRPPGHAAAQARALRRSARHLRAVGLRARPAGGLGAALAAVGHDATRPTLTIWEGVTMYLTEEAIADTVAAVRAWSAPRLAALLQLRRQGADRSPAAGDAHRHDDGAPLGRAVALRLGSAGAARLADGARLPPRLRRRRRRRRTAPAAATLRARCSGAAAIATSPSPSRRSPSAAPTRPRSSVACRARVTSSTRSDATPIDSRSGDGRIAERRPRRPPARAAPSPRRRRRPAPTTVTSPCSTTRAPSSTKRCSMRGQSGTSSRTKRSAPAPA